MVFIVTNDKQNRPIIVEGTAGNTGIGLAHICNALNLDCYIFMPNNQSREKVDYLKILGAKVFEFPVVPFTDPNNYNHKAREFAERTKNSYWTNQFDNLANTQAHYETTGPEIYKQTNGKLDAIVFSTGTGGTLSGVTQYLKSKNPKIKSYLADPCGSVLYNWFTNGKLERTEGNSITEGIGQGRITDNLKNAQIDGALFINEQKIIETTFKLLHEEGFFVGATSGINVRAAIEIALELGPGSTVVTCLCDSGQKYINRLYSKSELEKRALYNYVPEEYRQFLKE
jgi:cysteine synthase